MYEFLPYEALSEQHELPDPFLKPDGTRVASPEEWPAQREYLKEMLAHYLYGEMPPDPGNVEGTVTFSEPVMDGKAVRETAHLTFGPDRCLELNIEFWRPASEGKYPVLIWNSFGNSFGKPDSCPIAEELIDRGIALVSYEKTQLGVDGFAFVKQSPVLKAYPGCTGRAMAIWAWGYSRVIDWLITQDWVAADKLAVTGYSRNGKVALCAGIYDERIALVAPGGSGCGGSGLFRFNGNRFGEGCGTQETIGSMSQMLYYWWADGLREFGAMRDEPFRDLSDVVITSLEDYRKLADPSINGKVGPEFRLPFDMHFARALIAPRALICTDSLNDDWANPYGIQVSWRAAAEVYRFLGAEDNNAMLLREGPHAFSYSDWIGISDFIAAKLCGEDPKRSLFVTLQVPKSPEDSLNTSFPAAYFSTPHFSWRAPEM